MDLSEQCGHTIEEQITLFTNIKPLFAKKPIICVMNKIDIVRPDELSYDQKQRLDYFKNEGKIISCVIVENSHGHNMANVALRLLCLTPDDFTRQ